MGPICERTRPCQERGTPTLRGMRADRNFAQVALALHADMQPHRSIILQCFLCKVQSLNQPHGTARRRFRMNIMQLTVCFPVDGQPCADLDPRAQERRPRRPAFCGGGIDGRWLQHWQLLPAGGLLLDGFKAQRLENALPRSDVSQCPGEEARASSRCSHMAVPSNLLAKLRFSDRQGALLVFP